MSGRLKEGWKVVLADIEEFRRSNDLQRKPVVFTELGYVARVNSTIEPWAASGFSVLPTSEGETLVVWEDQPEDLEERALAVRALVDAHRELETAILEGLLYWKLSSIPAHREIEPFALIIGEGEEDPLLPALRRFTARRPLERFRRWIGRPVARGID